ncbi:MAG: protein translocase subunit SecD [Ruminiclostridium sp.]|nr:protein translocase subunit SecD [Ruminiclostridium sp.]
MKHVKKPVFFVVFLLIAVFTYFTIAGFSTYYGDIETVHVRGIEDIRWGIDIRGGVDVTFTPTEDYDATNNEMDSARAIIETRLVGKNITDYEIYVDYNSDRIICRFPWQANDDNFDPEQAVKELGETAMLTFRKGYSGEIPEGGTHEDLPLVLTGADVSSAEAMYMRNDAGTYEYLVDLKLNPSGKEAFKEATTEAQADGSRISIWMDDVEISAPTVEAVIADGQATISGGFETYEDANDLATKINGGALPFKLVTDSFSTISPTLGMGARDAMAVSGVIAFALISIMMIVMYRLPGTVAVISLAGQVAGTLAAVTGFFAFNDSFTLTIPGIAGIILAVGMGVDANVITNERIKEELHAGKTIDGALYAGFKRAFSAIFDGNITMLIIAVILMGAFGTPDSICSIILTPIFTWFGVSTAGSIYSFGYTLAVGVVLNFLFGILTTRLMTMSLSRFKVFRKPALYGGKKAERSGN